MIEYYGKNVNIIAQNGLHFSGKVTDYFYPEDNESGVESIAIKDVYSDNYVEFPEEDIKSIEIMDYYQPKTI